MEIHEQIREMKRLEELSAGDTAVHRLNPSAKLLAAFIYLVCIMSLERHSVTRLSPFLFYPVLMCAFASVPAGLLLKRVLPALPFALFAGISCLLFERGPAGELAGIRISLGMLSFAMILCRTLLCVAAVMILVAVTPFADLMDALRRMHVPAVFADLLEMMYRYLSVLSEEAELMLTAFRLRSGGRSRPDIREFAPLISQLFLRSADRAERIYDAMKCRLYGDAARKTNAADASARKWTRGDWTFFLAAAASSLLFALADVPPLLGNPFISV